MDKPRYMQLVEYYSCWKEMSDRTTKKRKLKYILLNYRTQVENATRCVSPALWLSGKGTAMVGVVHQSSLRATQRKGGTGEAKWSFRTMKPVCVIPQWWTPVIINVPKPKACTTPRVNSTSEQTLDSGWWWCAGSLAAANIIPPAEDADHGRHTICTWSKGIWEIAAPASELWT